MIALRKAEAQLRRDTLAEVVVDFASIPIDPTPTQLAEAMQERLGVTFRIEQLYTANLLPIWRPKADYFGRVDEDQLPCAADFRRMNRRVLMAKVLRMKRQIELMERACANELIRQSTEQGWSLAELSPSIEAEAA